MSTKLNSTKNLNKITSKKSVYGSSVSASPLVSSSASASVSASPSSSVGNNKVRNLYLTLRKKTNSKFQNTSKSSANQVKTNRTPVTARSLQNREAPSKTRDLRRVNSACSDSKKKITTSTPTPIPTSTKTTVITPNANETNATTAVTLVEPLTIPENKDEENATLSSLTEVTPPPPPPAKITTSAKETTVEDTSKASNKRVSKGRMPANKRQASTSAKTTANGNQWRSPFKSFVSTGVRVPNNCNSKLDCGRFAYHLSRDELKYLGTFNSPMKPAPASERQLLESGQRIKYLNQRYEYSPNRKYNYPEATSWRIGWLHNHRQHGHGDNRNSAIVPCS